MDVHSTKNGINRYWSIPMWLQLWLKHTKTMEKGWQRGKFANRNRDVYRYSFKDGRGSKCTTRCERRMNGLLSGFNYPVVFDFYLHLRWDFFTTVSRTLAKGDRNRRFVGGNFKIPNWTLAWICLSKHRQCSIQQMTAPCQTQSGHNPLRNLCTSFALVFLWWWLADDTRL